MPLWVPFAKGSSAAMHKDTCAQGGLCHSRTLRLNKAYAAAGPSTSTRIMPQQDPAPQKGLCRSGALHLNTAYAAAGPCPRKADATTPDLPRGWPSRRSALRAAEKERYHVTRPAAVAGLCVLSATHPQVKVVDVGRHDFFVLVLPVLLPAEAASVSLDTCGTGTHATRHTQHALTAPANATRHVQQALAAPTHVTRHTQHALTAPANATRHVQQALAAPTHVTRYTQNALTAHKRHACLCCAVDVPSLTHKAPSPCSVIWGQTWRTARVRRAAALKAACSMAGGQPGRRGAGSKGTRYAAARTCLRAARTGVFSVRHAVHGTESGVKAKCRLVQLMHSAPPNLMYGLPRSTETQASTCGCQLN